MPRSKRPRRGKHPWRSPVAILAVLFLVALLALLERAGWTPLDGEDAPPELAFRAPEGAVAPVDYGAVYAALDRIRVEPERRRGYDRDDWPHWLDLDGDCLNVRDEVLTAESLEPVRLAADGCDVVGGLWRDAYTGEVYRDPRALDIDHLVALQEAHDSGGHGWDRARRAAFANDLGDPRSLIAVGRSVNRAKGAQGPEEWLPPNPGYRCRYVADWTLTKARWELTMDESERVAVGNILNACRAESGSR